MYADDVQFYVCRPLSLISECINVCNSELTAVNECARNNGLSLN